jgi:uncharacterized protein
MTWMITATGKKFDFANPKASIDITDIALSLSKVCRFGGHVKSFYSVAAHSVHVSRLVPKELALLGLLHDAPEAYIGDIVRPLKELVSIVVRPIETRIETDIFETFGIGPFSSEQWAALKKADDIALATERRDLIVDHTGLPWSYERRGVQPDANVKLAGSQPLWDCDAFLARFKELTA